MKNFIQKTAKGLANNRGGYSQMIFAQGCKFSAILLLFLTFGITQVWATSYSESTFFQAVSKQNTASITQTEASAGTNHFITKDCSSAFTMTTGGNAVIGFYATGSGTTQKYWEYNSKKGGLKSKDVGLWIVLYSSEQFVAGDSIVIANGNASNSNSYTIVGAASNNTTDFHSVSTVSSPSATQPAKNSNYYYILPNNFTASNYLVIRNNSTSIYFGGLYAYHAAPSCETPDAPTSLAKSTGSYNSLTFTWTKASNASTYTATLYPDEDCEETPVATQELGDVATVTFNDLEESTTYYCKVQSHGNGTTYCENGGTTSAASGTTAAEPKTVYLKNTMGWENAYLNFYSASYWDESNGTGNSTGSSSYISGPIAMSYDDATGMFYYETDDADELVATIVSFTKDNQSNYGNFNGTEAIYSFSAFEFDKVFVPVTQSDTYTKNSGNTKYYTYTVEDYEDADGPGYYLWANGQSWEPKNNEFTDNGDGTLTFTKSLSASTKYQFKINERNNAWGSATFVIQPIENRTFASDAAACALYTGPAGDYIFTIDTTTKAVSVSYPSVTHPATGYAYFKKWNDWEGYYVHWWKTESSTDIPLTAWGSDPQITTDAEICDTHYAYFPILSDYPSLIVKEAAGDASDKTGSLSSSGSSGKYFDFTNNNAWNSFGNTVTYNANKGSGEMESSAVPCGSVTLRQNTFTRSGWTFKGWNTDKYGGGTSYTDQQALEGVASDMTLYAQWERTIYLYSTASSWYNGGALFKLHYWDASDTSNNDDVMMELADECSNPKVYKATISGGGYDKLLFYRLNPDDLTDVWNQTVDLDFNATYDMYKLTNMEGGENNNAYGVFESSYSGAPTLTISFANGGGSGSMSSITSIACEGEAEVPDNGFTAPSGKQFAYWTANVDVTADDEEVEAGEEIAVGATLSNITSNITLTANWEDKLYTITYNANGGSVTPTSATQASAGAAITLATPTRSGCTFEGWYNNGTKIGNAGASFIPTKDTTLYAHFIDNLEGKLFSYIDGLYGDKYKAFDGTHWLTSTTSETSGDNTTFTNADGVRKIVNTGRYEGKNGIISSFIKYKSGTTKDTIIIPAGKIATVKILYGAYGTGDKYKLTINGVAQAAPPQKLSDNQRLETDTLKEIILSNQKDTLLLTTGGNNIYFAKVSAVITGYDVSDCWDGNTYKCADDVQIPKSGSTTWGTATWGTTPTASTHVFLPSNMTIASGTTALAKEVVLQNGANLTVAAGGALIVADGITGASAEALTLGSSVENGNATLIYDISEGLSATVQMASKATTTGGSWTWQYVGVPVAGVAENLYSNGYMYKWNNGWSAVAAKDDLVPFAGYCVSYDGAGHVFEMGGALTTTTAKTIDVAANSAQVIGNSWTAPIQIKQMDADDFTNVTQTIYLFNTGSDEKGTGEEAGSSDRYAPGTYQVLPIASVKSGAITYTTSISALQGFFVKNNTESAGSITLDYAKHVRPVGENSVVNGPMHAPKRAAKELQATVARLTVSGSRYDDQVILIENDECSRGFDNGWDGEKIGSSNVSPWIYALREDGTHDAVSATNDMEGTVLGFRKGEDSQYTMSFDYNGEDMWYLNDVKAEQATLIDDANTYTFTATENDAARFIISQTPIYNVPTGIENGANDEDGVRVRKQVIDGMLYIIKDGKIFNAQGAAVK